MIKANRIKDESRAEKLERLNSFQYDILLREKGGKFYLYIPEISLVAQGDDLTGAYKDLCQQRQDFFNKILDCQAEDEIALPRRLNQGRQTFYQLKMFTLKLLIVCFLMGSTFIFGGAVLRDKIANISGGDIVKKVTKGVTLEVAKFTNTPEDIKQIRIKKFRQFLETLRPWIDEVRSVFLSGSSDGTGGKNSDTSHE